MSKVKDFETQEEAIDQEMDTSFEEVMQYYDAKERSYHTSVTIVNANMLDIIKTLSVIDYSNLPDQKLEIERLKTIQKAIKGLKFTEE